MEAFKTDEIVLDDKDYNEVEPPAAVPDSAPEVKHDKETVKVTKEDVPKKEKSKKVTNFDKGKLKLNFKKKETKTKLLEEEQADNAVKQKKEKKVKKKVNKDEKPKKVPKTIADVLPIVDISDEGYIELKNGFMEILQIESEDMSSLKDDDIDRIIRSLTKFLRVYTDDFKWVGMRFPKNTSKQKEYWIKQMANTEDPIRFAYQQKKVEELELLEKTRTSKEYYLFLFSPNRLDSSELTDNIKTAKKEHRTALPLKQITPEKKYQILYKFNNQNSKIM